MPAQRQTALDLNLPNTPISVAPTADELLGVYNAFKQVNEYLGNNNGHFLLPAGLSTLLQKSFVNIASDGTVFPANNTNVLNRAVAFVPVSIGAGKIGVVDFSNNIHDGFTGLTVGGIYFLANSLGGITLVPPVASGTIVQEVGVSISPTELFVRIQTPFVNP